MMVDPYNDPDGRGKYQEAPMPNYGTHTYTTELQGELVLSGNCFDDGLQWEVSVTVACTYPGCAAQFYGPPENCYPAEGPEFEFISFVFFVGKTKIVNNGTWDVALALFGAHIWNQLYNDAVINAEENPDD